MADGSGRNFGNFVAVLGVFVVVGLLGRAFFADHVVVIVVGSLWWTDSECSIEGLCLALQGLVIVGLAFGAHNFLVLVLALRI